MAAANREIVPVQLRTKQQWLKLQHPSRSYWPGLVWGDPNMLGLTISTNPDFSHLKDQLEKDEIPLDLVASLYLTHSIPHSELDPAIMHAHANMIRVTVHKSKRLDSRLADQYSEIEGALEKLMRLLPARVVDAGHELEDAPLPDFCDTPYTIERRIAFHRERVHALEKLLKGVMGAYPYATTGRPRKKTSEWHEDAKALQCILREGAKRLGSELDFGNATAPAVLFIHEVLTLAGVDHEGKPGTGPGNIAKIFVRRDSQIKKEVQAAEQSVRDHNERVRRRLAEEADKP